MEISGKAKYIRMSPRKVRLVADVVRGLNVNAANEQLSVLNKRAVKPIRKLILAVIANAENDFEIEKNNLYIKEIRVDEGPTLKRWRPRARGRAAAIRKRTSHIVLKLAEIKETGTQKKKKKIDKPISLGTKPKEAEGVVLKKEKDDKETSRSEKGKKIVNPRAEGRGKHTKIEGAGGEQRLVKKIFRRKSG